MGGQVTYLYFVNIVYGMVEFYRLLPWLLLLVGLGTILVGYLGRWFLSGSRRLMIGMLGGLSWSTRYMTWYWLLKNMFYIGLDEQKNLKNKIVIIFLSYIHRVFWVVLSTHNIYSNRKDTSDFHGTVYFGPVKMLRQKISQNILSKSDTQNLAIIRFFLLKRFEIMMETQAIDVVIFDFKGTRVL